MAGGFVATLASGASSASGLNPTKSETHVAFRAIRAYTFCCAKYNKTRVHQLAKFVKLLLTTPTMISGIPTRQFVWLPGLYVLSWYSVLP